jgi:hypothetical protein
MDSEPAFAGPLTIEKGSVNGIDILSQTSSSLRMPRKLRVEYPGAIYYLMNRGDRRESISKDDTDRQMFPALLGRCCLKTGWQVHVLVLTPNHFHLVVETPQPTWSRAGNGCWGCAPAGSTPAPALRSSVQRALHVVDCRWLGRGLLEDSV